jgi:hypothetical protein
VDVELHCRSAPDVTLFAQLDYDGPQVCSAIQRLSLIPQRVVEHGFGIEHLGYVETTHTDAGYH